MPPGFFCNSPQICPKPTKPLGRNAFSFGRLMTPTFPAVPVEIQRKALWSLGSRLGSQAKAPPLTTI